ncbi:hypothetical protein BH11PLA2_BH11PLA2_26450 [soil metagenome]
MPRFSAGIALAICAFIAAGCDSHPKVVKVSGQVLIDGQPLRHGFIQIVPDGQRAAMAKLDNEGRFTLSTDPNKTDDGVAPGTHRVAVIGLETLDAGSQRWNAPKKYSTVEESGLTVTIDKAMNDLTVNLPWAGGKPFIEYAGKD